MGEIKRTHLYNKMVKSSFMPEYKRQWVADMKRKGWYKPTKEDSLEMKKQDSLKKVQLKLKLKEDSIKKVKLQNKNNI